jgi:hypothetical protein
MMVIEHARQDKNSRFLFMKKAFRFSVNISGSKIF